MLKGERFEVKYSLRYAEKNRLWVDKVKKVTFTELKLFTIVATFCWVQNVMSIVEKENKIKPRKTPVELVHGKKVKLTKMAFFKNESVKIKLLFNKDDLTNGL